MNKTNKIKSTVEGEENVVVGVGGTKIRQLAVVRGEGACGLLQFQVLDRIVVPTLTEGLPVTRIHLK